MAYVPVLIFCTVLAKWLKKTASAHQLSGICMYTFVQRLQVIQLSVTLTHGEAKMHFNCRGHTILIFIYVIVLLDQ